MAFWGRGFTFDGISCDEYNLTLYDIGGTNDDEAPFASTVSIVEETVGSKWKPYFYGVRFEDKLEFELVFGVNEDRIESGLYLDRSEVAKIASWLTGHHEYKWLTIEQDDIRSVRYKCMITELSIIPYGKVPWAMRATVTCDSPFAYSPEEVAEYKIAGSGQITYNNKSDLNGYYYPIMEFVRSGGNEIRIVNATDGLREFVLSGIPSSVKTIRVDHDKCIISNDQSLNLYGGCNYKFLRLKRGENVLRVTGNGTLRFISEFAVNIGG